MQLQRFMQLEEFCAQALPFLLQQPVHHNLLLGMVGMLKQQAAGATAPYLAIVTKAGQPIAVAMRTSPYGLVLSAVADEAAVAAIGQDVLIDQPDLVSVNALAPVAAMFTTFWQAQAGKLPTLRMAMKIHQLTEVTTLATVGGALRRANAGDREWLLAWYVAFKREVWGTIPRNGEAWLGQRLQQQDLFVWQDQEPVALVCGDMIPGDLGRIFLVYTPPKYRRRGYASAAVAAVSQGLLDGGARLCVLFTDLANPTANKIYQAVGYEPICEWLNYQFEVLPRNRSGRV
jgi:uncharacterized protein